MHIESGDWPPGTPIPTINELTERWHTSPRTARDAHALLRQQGLVTGRQGTVLRVRTPPRLTVRSSDRHQLEKDRVRLPKAERARLGTSEIELQTPVHNLTFQCTYHRIKADRALADAFRVSVSTPLLQRVYETTDKTSGARQSWSVSYLPIALIETNSKLLDASEEPWPGGTQHQLYTVGIEIAEMIDEVTSTMPTTVDQQMWELEDGIPLLKVRRLSVDTLGRVVEITDAIFPADRTKLTFKTTLNPW